MKTLPGILNYMYVYLYIWKAFKGENENLENGFLYENDSIAMNSWMNIAGLSEEIFNILFGYPFQPLYQVPGVQLTTCGTKYLSSM